MSSRNENIYLFLLEEMRTSGGSGRQVKEILRTPEILQKQAPRPTIAAKCPIAQESTEQDSLAILKKINKEEKDLINEKNELMHNSQILQQKIAEQIEIRKHRIENSKAEITGLEQKCQYLQAVIKTSFPK
jgi:hypothetical protein